MIKCFRMAAAVLAAISLLAACAGPGGVNGGAAGETTAGAAAPETGDTAYTRVCFYLDTVIDMTVYAEDAAAGTAALDAAEAVFERVHGLTDRFLAGSDVYRINGADPPGSPVPVEAETYELIETALEYCEQSGGAFDIGLGAVSDLWDFGDDGASGGGTVPDAERLAGVVSSGGYKRLALDGVQRTVAAPAGTRLDLGGIAKGYALQCAVAALRDAGIESAVIDAGGSVYAVGAKPVAAASQSGASAPADGGVPWKIGIRHPRQDETGMEPLAAVRLTDMAVVTSGDYMRFFTRDGVRYHHILDPATGWPASGCVSVTVIAEDAALADYLSTALFVLGPERGMELVAEYPGVDAMIVSEGLAVAATPGMDAYMEMY